MGFRFSSILLAIMWILNSITFIAISTILKKSRVRELAPQLEGMIGEFHKIQRATGLAFLLSFILGTFFILLALRGIIKPIKKLSMASKAVSKGDFNVRVENKRKDEIGEFTDDFNKMVDGLQSIETLRKDFVSSVSHEFRTPITSIRGFAKLIQDENLDPQLIKEYSDIIINETDRLMGLSSNLLRLSELDNQSINRNESDFMLDEQIRKIILMLEPQWSVKHIHMEVQLQELSYFGDEELLQQVWINIIQNAIKFTGQNGIIQISAYAKESSIYVTVTDNGIGISVTELPKIFGQFYKGEHSRGNEGNGLGLSIVKKIVEYEKGSVTVLSKLNEGTQFQIRLSNSRNKETIIS
jgi:signal transduction histidine kinase